VRQDFFDLGGNSLLVMRMLSRIEREFGMGLSTAQLFQAATIESLAAIIRQNLAPPPKVIALKPSGTRPPLFFVQPLPILRPLARRLDPDQPVLGLPLPEAPAACGLSELARPLVRAVRERQPEGPYFLAGWCAYGRIAHEIAQQLQEQGEEVAMVVLIDSAAPGHRRRRGRTLSVWRRFGWEVRYHVASLSQLRPAEALVYMFERSLKVIRPGRGSAGGSEAMMGNRRLLRQIAATPYGPVPYSGRAVVFRGKGRRPVGDRLGWDAMAGDNLEIVDVPGTHLTMFLEPHVEVLARELDRRLRRCQRPEPLT